MHVYIQDWFVHTFGRSECPLMDVFKSNFCVCMITCVCMKMCKCFLPFQMCSFSIGNKATSARRSRRSPCSGAQRGIASLIAVEKPHQCQALWFMSLILSTSSSFPLGFTIFSPLFSPRRYRPCPGLSAGPAPYTIKTRSVARVGWGGGEGL